MNETQMKRLVESHAKMINILISYYKSGLSELESMPATQLMFEKTIREGVKVDALMKTYNTYSE